MVYTRSATRALKLKEPQVPNEPELRQFLCAGCDADIPKVNGSDWEPEAIHSTSSSTSVHPKRSRKRQSVDGLVVGNRQKRVTVMGPSADAGRTEADDLLLAAMVPAPVIYTAQHIHQQIPNSAALTAAVTEVRNVAPHSAPPTEKQQRAYIVAREAGVRKCRFPLEAIVGKEIHTSRTIKSMQGWNKLWPVIREFMQNTIDHLELMENGRRHAALTVRCEPGNGGVRIDFCCADTAVCSIAVQENSLTIDQLYTYPLHPRALDTGVCDSTKTKGKTAGGFGDGFKTAALALFSLRNLSPKLSWTFESQGMRIVWDFRAIRQMAVSTFQASETLAVQITKYAISSCRENFMQQCITATGIGGSFLQEALPRLQVFWEIDATLLIGQYGGDFLAEASAQHLVTLPAVLTLGGKQVASPISPAAGIYVKGIWVQKGKLPQALMCFYRSLDVAGRDRNSVDHEQLLDSTTKIFRTAGYCDQRVRLAGLLQSLHDSTAKRSWITGSGGISFLDEIIRANRTFFLEVVFGYPKGAIFLSKKAAQSRDPFISWACRFLTQKGAPVVAIERCSNVHLFEEITEAELTHRCAVILKQDPDIDDPAKKKALESATRKIMKSLGNLCLTVNFSKSLCVTFVYASDLFLPFEPLTKRFLLKILNVIMRNADVKNDNFAHLMQGICEKLPHSASLQPEDINTAVQHAEQIKREMAASERGAISVAASETGQTLIDCTAEDTENGGIRTSFCADMGIMDRIQELNRSAKAPFIDSIPGGYMNGDHKDDDGECCSHRTLHRIACNNDVGGGEIFCSESVAPWLHWNTSDKKRLRLLREVLVAAKSFVVSAQPLLRRTMVLVQDGFEPGGQYKAFCADNLIVINLCPFLMHMPRQVVNVSSCPTLQQDLVVTLLHEIAHLVEHGTAHGLAWRANHAALLSSVYSVALKGASH